MSFFEELAEFLHLKRIKLNQLIGQHLYQLLIWYESEAKRKWIGHTLRKPHNSVTKQALFWNPHGKETVGGQKTTGEDQPNKNCDK